MEAYVSVHVSATPNLLNSSDESIIKIHEGRCMILILRERGEKRMEPDLLGGRPIEACTLADPKSNALFLRTDPNLTD